MDSHFLHKALWVAYDAAVVAAVMGLVTWIKYARAKRKVDKRDEKEDVQTLFDRTK
jgi:membrane associated rhomboid family serine protease